jgi:predicted GNAT family N-acyltransferase
MEYARTKGRDRFYLTAQSDKLSMYQKLGFAAFGPEFIDGGMPHRAMRSYDKDTAELTD